jgi:hypothetical protein
MQSGIHFDVTLHLDGSEPLHSHNDVNAAGLLQLRPLGNQSVSVLIRIEYAF